jgi:hypothetical protein
VPLRKRPLRLCNMTADRAPWVGTVTAPEPPSPLEVQRCVAQAIGRSTYSWPPSRMLPMLPNTGTEKFVSRPSSRHVSFALCRGADLLGVDLRVFLLSQLKCAHLFPAKAPLPEEAIFNQNKAATEKRCAVRRAQHKKCQITKRDRNDNRTKRQKAGELGVSSEEDSSPEPSWSGDVACATVDWSNMSGSSSSSPPRGAEVSSSHWPQATGHDKTVGSSSRQAAPPERTSGQSAPVRRLAGRALPSRKDLRPVKPILREGQRSGRRPPASSMTARTAPTLIPCRGAGRGGGHRTRRRR